jgi:Zn ribbon nucleic-acid-binding protein
MVAASPKPSGKISSPSVNTWDELKWDELQANVQDAVKAFYFDQQKPFHVRLQLRRNEVLAVA